MLHQQGAAMSTASDFHALFLPECEHYTTVTGRGCPRITCHMLDQQGAAMNTASDFHALLLPERKCYIAVTGRVYLLIEEVSEELLTSKIIQEA